MNTQTAMGDAFERAFADDRASKEKPGETETAAIEPQVEPPPEMQAEEQPPETEAKAQEAPKAQPAEPERQRIDPEQFKGYLDEREKRQAIERELQDLKRELAQHQQKPKDPPPDRYEDPEAYDRYRDAQISQQLLANSVRQSRFLAVREFGEPLVNDVQKWADSLPEAHRQSFLDHPSPFHAAIEAYQQHKASEALRPHGYDLEKLKSEWRKEWEKTSPRQPEQQQEAQPAAPNLPPKILGQGGGQNEAPVMSRQERFNRFFS